MTAYRPTSRNISRAAVTLLLSWVVAGCAGQTSVDGSARLQPSNAGLGATAQAFRVGSGDKIKVTVFGEPDLSGGFDVTAQGTIAMPLIGDVPARGLTIDELRVALTRRLSEGYLKSPKVTVEVMNYRPLYVHGEVRSGGEFQFKHGLKLRDAIAMAGGYTYRANTSYLLITRSGSPMEMRVDMPSDAVALPGDNIRVPERFF